MIDVWRELHPSVKTFTFFSHPHTFYSRIDYFFMFKSERHRIIDCDIGVRDVSDHAGGYLRLHLDILSKSTLWRLNTSLLNDSHCVHFTEKEIREYLEFNNTEDISPSVLWDAAKAVLRGKLIMWSSKEKRETETIE